MSRSVIAYSTRTNGAFSYEHLAPIQVSSRIRRALAFEYGNANVDTMVTPRPVSNYASRQYTEYILCHQRAQWKDLWMAKCTIGILSDWNTENAGRYCGYGAVTILVRSDACALTVARVLEWGSDIFRNLSRIGTGTVLKRAVHPVPSRKGSKSPDKHWPGFYTKQSSMQSHSIAYL